MALDSFEVNGWESEAKAFDFKASQFLFQRTVEIGRDIYKRYITLDNFNNITYSIDFDYQKQKYDFVYMSVKMPPPTSLIKAAYWFKYFKQPNYK